MSMGLGETLVSKSFEFKKAEHIITVSTHKLNRAHEGRESIPIPET
jgi:hypothetical protein